MVQVIYILEIIFESFTVRHTLLNFSHCNLGLVVSQVLDFSLCLYKFTWTIHDIIYV